MFCLPNVKTLTIGLFPIKNFFKILKRSMFKPELLPKVQIIYFRKILLSDSYHNQTGKTAFKRQTATKILKSDNCIKTLATGQSKESQLMSNFQRSFTCEGVDLSQ